MRLKLTGRAKEGLKRLVGRAQILVDLMMRSSAPRAVLARLNDRALDFFRRRYPAGDNYAFEVHYAPALENVPTNLDRFHLVGRNWRHASAKPVAIAIGFNDWKYGFIADYCPGERIAFAPRTYIGWRARRDLRRMQPKPSCIYVWGYTDTPWLQRFARRRGIPFVRVEDAFLRSAKLGASHATPYSLAFDRQGLYYNTNEPNDLADILAAYDFVGDGNLMEEARKALDLLIEKRLSKYNPPDLYDPARHFAVKTRKRVLVIGQVDNDAAVRMGNPQRWRMSDILRLAKLENPDAEILYRPHPETYRGFQRTKFKALLVERFATVVPPEGSLLDMLDTVDHVYTISSLSGLEALVRGIKVTTLGTAFYAGWGLTDDRVKKPSGRKLSVLELFAGTYLKYPRYLADLEDSWSGFRVAALRILADRDVHLSTALVAPSATDGEAIAASDRWPSLLLREREANATGQIVVLLDRIVRWMRDNPSDLAQAAVAHAVLGWLRSPEERDMFLRAVTGILTPPVVNELLLHLIEAEGPHSYQARHLAELVHRTDPGGASARLVAPIRQGRFAQEEAAVAPASERESASAEEAHLKFLESRLAAQMNDARYSDAVTTAKRLLLGKVLHIEALLALAEIALTRFDFGTVRMLAGLLFMTGEPRAVNKAPSLELEALEAASPAEITEAISRYLAFKPEKIVNAVQALERYCEPAELEQTKAQVLATVKLANSLNVAKVQSLLAVELVREALETADQLARSRPHLPQVAVVFAQALAANDRVREARDVINRVLKVHPTSLVYRESLRLCIIDNDYANGIRLISESISRRIDLGDMLHRKIYFGARRIKDAFAMFKEFYLRSELIRHFPQKYCRDPIRSEAGRSIFAAAIFGPGDEMRWAYIYNLLPSILPHNSISIACDPRLHSLMQRSFPHIGFVPVRRIRNADRYSIADFDRVPSSRLVGVLDNAAIAEIERADDFVLITDLLSDVLEGYESFSGEPFLRADPAKVASFRARLPRLPLIGLSWRSSVVSHARNEHYITIEELAPLFAIPDVQFVNLQYDDCDEELAWVEKNFPGKLINFQDLDQFNDFDGVSALMCSLDLIISSMTTPAELAGGLGCPTWLLSNSSELHWRKRPASTVDVWHNSMRHIEGEIASDKPSLVEAVKRQLEAWLPQRSQSAAPKQRKVVS